MTRIYMDGVFDMFHYGHLSAIEQAYNIGNKLSSVESPCWVIIGIISDEDTESYKRLPIATLGERTKIIKALKYVDQVISPAPLIVTKEFIKSNNIDIVVHGFANDADFEAQKEQHRELIEMGIFRRINYTSSISTTDIIDRILSR